MKKLLKQFSIFAGVFALAATFGTDAFATTSSTGYGAGQSIYDDLVGNLTGTAGTTVGLVISLFGLYMWIWNQVTWGLMIAIGGGLITVYPSIFTNLKSGAADALTATASGKASAKG